MSRRLFVMPLAALTAVAFVAFAGDGKGSSAFSAGGVDSTSQHAARRLSGGTIDVNQSAAQFGELKSFRFDVRLKLDFGSAGSAGGINDLFGADLLAFFTDVSAEGAYVAPDKLEVKLHAGPLDMAVVQIGNESWVKFDETWQAGDYGNNLGLAPSDPGELLKELVSSLKLSSAKTSKESVNGVMTTRYSFDKEALEKLAESLGAGAGEFRDIDEANLDLWLNQDDVPVKLSMAVTGKDEEGQKVAMDLQMNLKDINSNIEIKPPV